jgi:hypothetical protein
VKVRTKLIYVTSVVVGITAGNIMFGGMIFVSLHMMVWIMVFGTFMFTAGIIVGLNSRKK